MRALLTIIFYSFYLLFPLIIFLFLVLWRQKEKSIELIFLIIFFLFLLWARFAEPHILRVKKYNFSTSLTLSEEEREKKSLKIAVFSDLHVGVFRQPRKIERVVNKVNKLKPDLVLIPGDFVYYSRVEDLEEQLSALAKLEAPAVAVLGNHDYGKKKKDLSRNISSVLEAKGVLMLDNKIKQLFIKNQKIEIIGLADIWAAEPDYSILQEASADADLSLILAHNPDTAYKILQEEGIEAHYDLMISGHTHAGQIRFPFLYKHLIPSRYGFDQGFYKVSDRDVFVSGGIGNSVLPLRLFNFPEISLINIDF